MMMTMEVVGCEMMIGCCSDCDHFGCGYFLLGHGSDDDYDDWKASLQ
jgi:hypothetical protein